MGDTKPGKSLSQGGHNVVQLFAGDISEFQGQQTKQMKNEQLLPCDLSETENLYIYIIFGVLVMMDDAQTIQSHPSKY